MFLLILYFLRVFAYGVQLPSSIKLCSLKDPKLPECFKNGYETALKTFANGYKPIGFPQLEPFYIEEMTVGENTPLLQKYTKVNIHGFTNIKASNVKFDFKNNEMSFNGFIPMFISEGDYEMKGQLLLFSLNSHGKYNISLFDMACTNYLKWELYEKNGKTYMKPLKYVLTFQPNSVKFDFSNIIEGNSELSDNVNQALNDNGMQLFNEIKPDMEKIFSLISFQVINLVFSKIPFNELFLDYQP